MAHKLSQLRNPVLSYSVFSSFYFIFLLHVRNTNPFPYGSPSLHNNKYISTTDDDEDTIKEMVMEGYKAVERIWREERKRTESKGKFSTLAMANINVDFYIRSYFIGPF